MLFRAEEVPMHRVSNQEEQPMLSFIRHTSAVALLAIASTAGAASITLINPGPASSFNFDVTVNNNSGGTIGSISIDLSGTTATQGGGSGSLVFGGAFNSIAPAGGTAVGFGTQGTPVFGFNYTGFSDGLSHTFGWDPDTAGNDFYGAVVSEYVGALVSATVGGVNWTGTFVFDQGNNYAIATLTDGTTVVPVPGALVLMLSGLAGFGALARRKSAAA
ncbi:MAG: VPLPA-CTERM sorting domain-containing protein [Betaproteobacteria bacterium]|nr:VPLPA-CTERM sorting domain-containing protein [Betaproteobacteria bacterium]